MARLEGLLGLYKIPRVFFLRAILRMFKFEPVEFSPCPRPAGHPQKTRMLKIVPDDFFEPYDEQINPKQRTIKKPHQKTGGV